MQDIYLARADHDLVMEETLTDELIDIYRSSESMRLVSERKDKHE
jgi:hypothetical protein